MLRKELEGPQAKTFIINALASILTLEKALTHKSIACDFDALLH